MLNLITIEHEVRSRLTQLDIKNDQISIIAKRAISQKLNAVSNHPANAPGTFAYHEGVRAMRDVLIDGEKWNKLTENGIEYVENPIKKIRIIYQNVDIACNQKHDPQPISKRGGSAKCDVINSNQTDLFGFESTPSNVWVICVSENNGIINAEFSLPTVMLKNGSFSQFSERIFILQDSEIENATNSFDDNSGNGENYDDDINISLKN